MEIVRERAKSQQSRSICFFIVENYFPHKFNNSYVF